jgi:hypothetical protein
LAVAVFVLRFMVAIGRMAGRNSGGSRPVKHAKGAKVNHSAGLGAGERAERLGGKGMRRMLNAARPKVTARSPWGQSPARH